VSILDAGVAEDASVQYFVVSRFNGG